MIEGNEEVENVEGAEIVVADQNPDQAGIINEQLPEPEEGVDELPQAPEVEQNPFLHALGIQLIAERIYNYLDIKSLSNCLYLHRDLNTDLRVIIAWRRPIQFTNFESDETIEPLRDCFEALEILPRSRYTFTNHNAYFTKHFDHEDFQEFRRRLGGKIRELCLIFPEDASNWYFRSKQDSTETTAMELIKSLLTSQAVFMRKLSLNIFCLITWNETLSARARPLRKTDQELDSIQSEANASAKNQSLRKLEILGNISSKVMELIICLAPNLQEIQVPKSDYDYLVEPINRLKFLKSITVSGRNVNTLERLVAVNTGNLKLREFKIELWEPEVQNQETLTRLILIINNLFNTSYDTLEFLHWDGIAMLQQLVWPDCFPKVYHIKIGNPLEGSNLDSNIFPENFEFSRVFSAVKKVTMYHDANLNNQIDFVAFLNCLNLEPVGTVSTVDVSSWQASDQDVIRNILRPVFPNANEISFHRFICHSGISILKSKLTFLFTHLI